MILSSGIIVVRRAENRWLYLLLRAYRNWDFPKGEPRPGEAPLQTARREVREETGLEDFTWPWGRIFRETEPYNNGRKQARYYLAATDESKVVFSVNPKLGRPEHHEYRWVEYAELRELTASRLRPVVDWLAEVVEGADMAEITPIGSDDFPPEGITPVATPRLPW
jgi:bis(5'-nucleosidyl)-tetraphosphatase